MWLQDTMSKHSKHERKDAKPQETPVAKEMREQVNDLKQKMALEAQHIVHEIIPSKVGHEQFAHMQAPPAYH